MLLVTHNIALTAPIADHVLLLTKDGHVSMQGSVADVLRRNTTFRAEVEKDEKVLSREIDGEADEDAKEDTEGKKVAGKLVVAEEKAMGHVRWAALMLFIAGVGTPLVWAAFTAIQWTSLLMFIGQTWFMGYWSSQYEIRPPSEVPAMLYVPFLHFLLCAIHSVTAGISAFSWLSV